MILDAHNHIGRKKGLSFSADDLLRKMDESKIDKSFVFSFPENITNDYVKDACKQHADRLYPFVVVNPWDEKAEETVRRYVGDCGFYGIKLHSLKHGFNFDNHLLLDPLFALAEEYGVPVMAYGAANVLSVSNMFEEMARTFPKVNLVMIHSGQMYEAKPAISMAARNKNVYLETSTVFASNIKKQLADVGYDRILLGSDLPYGDYDLEIMKIQGETSDPEALSAILGGNAWRLIGGDRA